MHILPQEKDAGRPASMTNLTSEVGTCFIAINLEYEEGKGTKYLLVW
jgi:hypothetical protein